MMGVPTGTSEAQDRVADDVTGEAAPYEEESRASDDVAGEAEPREDDDRVSDDRVSDEVAGGVTELEEETGEEEETESDSAGDDEPQPVVIGEAAEGPWSGPPQVVVLPRLTGRIVPAPPAQVDQDGATVDPNEPFGEAAPQGFDAREPLGDGEAAPRGFDPREPLRAAEPGVYDGIEDEPGAVYTYDARVEPGESTAVDGQQPARPPTAFRVPGGGTGMMGVPSGTTGGAAGVPPVGVGGVAGVPAPSTPAPGAVAPTPSAVTPVPAPTTPLPSPVTPMPGPFSP
jgi:hypothetical protein